MCGSLLRREFGVRAITTLNHVFVMTAFRRFLALNNNGIGGSIPNAISTLNQLQELYLSLNSFSGGIPAAMSALTALT